MSPKKWLNQERMTTARNLLLKMATIKDVAKQLGFHDASHFCRAFRQNYGVSSSQFVTDFYAQKAEGNVLKVVQIR